MSDIKSAEEVALEEIRAALLEAGFDPAAVIDAHLPEFLGKIFKETHYLRDAAWRKNTHSGY